MSSPYNVLSIVVEGGSHDEKIKVTIDGLPSEKIDLDKLKKFLARRSSGKYPFGTPRKESDEVEFLAGMSIDGQINGRVVAVVNNENVRKGDYDFGDTPRPSHADYVAKIKYGEAFLGGGMFSGRTTVGYAIAGGICSQLCAKRGVTVASYISNIGGIEYKTYNSGTPNYEKITKCHDYILPIVDESEAVAAQIASTRLVADGDSIGGEIETVIYGVPAGIGGASYDNLEGRLAQAVFTIPGAKSFESGLGKGFARLRGSEANDPFVFDGSNVATLTNNSGGINGGVGNGMPITFRVAFRPTPSIAKEQKTVRLSTGEETTIAIKGRHDPCFLPRAVAVTEAMAATVILDAMLEEEHKAFRQKIDDIDDKVADLLSKRMKLSAQIGEYKKNNKLPIEDKARENEIKSRLKKNYPDIAEEIEAVYECLFLLSKGVQE